VQTERLKQLSVVKNATKGQATHPLQCCLKDPSVVCAAISSESNEAKKNALRQLSITGVVQAALHRSFIDHDLRQVQDSLKGSGGLSLSGACALLSYIIGDYLFVANAGDCRAVIGHNENGHWTVVQLSEDHRLDNENEKKRVVMDHPGETDIVKDGRVKGSLMPTRGLGDFAFKLKCLKPVLIKSDSSWNPPYITADPEVVQHKLNSGDKFLVIASDGLWEQFSNEEVVSMVSMFLQENSSDGKNNTRTSSNICTYLIEKVLRKVIGNTDDIVGALLHMDPKTRRQYHDDITITVIFFNMDNLRSNSIESAWTQDCNFVSPAPSSCSVQCVSGSSVSSSPICSSSASTKIAQVRVS